MMKEMKDSQPLWKRLLALTGFVILTSAALTFPAGGGLLSENFRLRRLQALDSFRELLGLSQRLSVEALVVSHLRPNPAPNPAEVKWLFRAYVKVTPSPRRFLMTGPILREKPLG